MLTCKHEFCWALITSSAFSSHLCPKKPTSKRVCSDADLGGGIAKKRIVLGWQGKSGARTLVATNKGNRWFFVFGSEKNERANISDEELALLERIATELDEAVTDGALQEICHAHED